jgi:hypothetical protein
MPLVIDMVDVDLAGVRLKELLVGCGEISMVITSWSATVSLSCSLLRLRVSFLGDVGTGGSVGRAGSNAGSSVSVGECGGGSGGVRGPKSPGMNSC